MSKRANPLNLMLPTMYSCQAATTNSAICSTATHTHTHTPSYTHVTTWEKMLDFHTAQADFFFVQAKNSKHYENKPRRHKLLGFASFPLCFSFSSTFHCVNMILSFFLFYSLKRFRQQYSLLICQFHTKSCHFCIIYLLNLNSYCCPIFPRVLYLIWLF